MCWNGAGKCLVIFFFASIIFSLGKSEEITCQCGCIKMSGEEGEHIFLIQLFNGNGILYVKYQFFLTFIAISSWMWLLYNYRLKDI